MFKVKVFKRINNIGCHITYRFRKCMRIWMRKLVDDNRRKPITIFLNNKSNEIYIKGSRYSVKQRS